MVTDPFSTLGLPARFDLADADIRRAFLARIAQIHPDAGEEDSHDAAAAELTEARRLLENPEQRAESLLVLLGGPGRSQDRSLPEGFLPEIMQVREEAEESRTDPAGAEQWRGWARERRSRHQARVGELFSSLGTPPRREVLGAIRTELNAWRYIERMIEQLDPAAGPGSGEGGT